MSLFLQELGVVYGTTQQPNISNEDFRDHLQAKVNDNIRLYEAEKNTWAERIAVLQGYQDLLQHKSLAELDEFTVDTTAVLPQTRATLTYDAQNNHGTNTWRLPQTLSDAVVIWDNLQIMFPNKKRIYLDASPTSPSDRCAVLVTYHNMFIVGVVLGNTLRAWVVPFTVPSVIHDKEMIVQQILEHHGCVVHVHLMNFETDMQTNMDNLYFITSGKKSRPKQSHTELWSKIMHKKF